MSVCKRDKQQCMLGVVVQIYPSEFGKERLMVEKTQGPPELKALPDDSEDDTEEEK